LAGAPVEYVIRRLLKDKVKKIKDLAKDIDKVQDNPYTNSLSEEQEKFLRVIKCVTNEGFTFKDFQNILEKEDQKKKTQPQKTTTTPTTTKATAKHG
jgi:hypothetical protein